MFEGIGYVYSSSRRKVGEPGTQDSVTVTQSSPVGLAPMGNMPSEEGTPVGSAVGTVLEPPSTGVPGITSPLTHWDSREWGKVTY